MGKKKSQKNKGKPPQDAPQQPAQPQSPPQAAAGPSDPASTSKGGKHKKSQSAQQQAEVPAQLPPAPAPSQPQPAPSQPKQPESGEPLQEAVKGKGKRSRKQAEQRPSELPSGGRQQGGGQQQQQRQQRGGQDGRRGSQQSTPSPQPGVAGLLQQQVAGRGQGRGQSQAPPTQGVGQRPVSQQQRHHQQPGSPHSASPSPQPGQGPWGRSQPPQQQYPPQQQPPPTAGVSQQQSFPVENPQWQQQQFDLQQQLRLQQLQLQQQQQVPRPPPGFAPEQQQPAQPQPHGAWQKPQQAQVPATSPAAQQQQPSPQPALATQKQQPQRTRPDHEKAQSVQAEPGQPIRGKHERSPLLELVIPQRKKLKSAGTAGRKILIETNHLALTLRKLDPVTHYDVVIHPDTPKKLMRAVMEEFRCKYYPQRYPAFDGTRNLYSSLALPFPNDMISGEVTIMEDTRPKVFKVTVKYAARVDLGVLSKYFEGFSASEAAVSAGDGNRHMITPQEAIQCLDVVLRSAPALHCTPVGRSFFTKPRDQIINLGDGMEMYYGFYQSAILGWKPFLNVDVAHKAFPKSLNVIDLILELCPRCDINARLPPYHFETVDKFMRTLKVQYEIPTQPTSKRVMRVNQLDRPASEARFRTDDGHEMTVAQYFKEVKAYSLKLPHMPCLWVGSRQRDPRILLPAELCVVMEGQVTNRVMTANQTSEMIKVAATSTTERKNKIMQSIRTAHFNSDPSAREFGISVSEDFSKVPARILDPPALKYATKSVKPIRGTWRAESFKSGKQLQRWCIISVDDRTRPPSLQDFSDMMISQGKVVGMLISKPQPVTSLRLTYRKEKQELETQFAKLKGMELILVVIPNENKDIYNFVKQVAELTVGTLTQCVRGKNVFRPKPATVGNILLKVNAKLNGVNHVLEVRPRCLNRPCMIMGADVTHPSPESRGTVPSVAAVTASHDPQAFQYNISWRLQPPTQEIISDLANIVKQHLVFFYQKNNQIKPERIIFFRDGVSEGQFQMVVNSEVHTIRQACTMVQKDGMYKPKITFLVVQKRHHTRFFPTSSRDSEDRNLNVPAGTVVDTDITHPTALDFYLVSHASIQGVARPTKYRMLWDDNEMNEDELEQLTYHLCHMFTRCTRSVSYPAPTYYAHLAAARAKVYCERRQLNMNDLEREQSQLVIKPDIVEGLPMFFV